MRLFLNLFFCASVSTIVAQNPQWARSVGQTNTDTKVQFTTKYSSNSLLVGGEFTASSLTLGSTVVPGAGLNDIFISTIDETGQHTWATSIGSSSEDYITALCSDEMGNIYVAGSFSGISITIGDTTLLNQGEKNAFLVKYKADKTIDWVRQFVSSSSVEVNGISTDSDGNVYINGQKKNQSSYLEQMFITKLSSSNQLVWASVGQGLEYSNTKFTPLTRDQDGDIYIAGQLSYGGLIFGLDTIPIDLMNLIL